MTFVDLRTKIPFTDTGVSQALEASHNQPECRREHEFEPGT